MEVPSSQGFYLWILLLLATGYWLLATYSQSIDRQVMNVNFFLFSMISFSSLSTLACCLFCLCDGSRRGQVLYRLHR